MSFPYIKESPSQHFTIKKQGKPMPKKKRSKGKNPSEDLKKAREENKKLSDKIARMKKIINSIYGTAGNYLIGEEATQ